MRAQDYLWCFLCSPSHPTPPTPWHWVVLGPGHWHVLAASAPGCAQVHELPNNTEAQQLPRGHAECWASILCCADHQPDRVATGKRQPQPRHHLSCRWWKGARVRPSTSACTLQPHRLPRQHCFVCVRTGVRTGLAAANPSRPAGAWYCSHTYTNHDHDHQHQPQPVRQPHSPSTTWAWGTPANRRHHLTGLATTPTPSQEPMLHSSMPRG
jgi:hypothetical protein